MDAKSYDLVVIGGGPSGEKGAAQVAYFGKKVAIVEKEEFFGGAAANTGTIPAKTLRETSLVLSGFKARNLFGVDLSLGQETNVEKFLHQERAVKERERERIQANLDRHRVDTFRGVGSFVDANTVAVEHPGKPTVHLRGEKFLICTGSSPRRPAEYPFGDKRVYESDSILRLTEMPKKMVVIGGGVIGVEYACTFAALGTDVSIVDRHEVLLGFLDKEISLALMDRMRKDGIEIVTDGVDSCEAKPNVIHLNLKSGKQLSMDGLLVCAGRTSNIEGLNLEGVGVETGDRGLIKKNEFFQTSVPHIYAVGDVVGFPALASTSMEQARVAMVHAFNLEYKKGVASVLPFGIYSIPEVSMAGETEEALKEKGIPYVVGRARYGDNPRGMIIGDYDGFLKLLYHRDDMSLLGVHVIGEIATEIVHIGLMALMTDAHSDLFIRACYNYPTLGDLYKYATYDAMGARQKALKS